MIKRSQHSLKFITEKKRLLLVSLFEEYQRVTNEFINLYWSQKDLVSKPNKDQWRQVQSWLCGKAMKCAYRQAIQMIKSAQDKNKKKIYASYKKVFKYGKKHNKNWQLLTIKFTEWSKDKQFRCRVKQPIFNGNSIDLNSDLVNIYLEPKKLKEFDMAIRLGSIFGNRLSLVLPTKKHHQLNKHISNGYEVCSSIQLRRINNQFYVNLFLEKETPSIKEEGRAIGIDVGIKKLVATSDGDFFGKEIEKKIQKLKGRKLGSKNHKQTISEIKDYIGQEVNRLDLQDVQVLVAEDIHVKNMSKKDKSSRSHRRTLNNWNSRLLFGRLSNKCEENRVFLSFINPSYTSQEHSVCHNIDKSSRSGEIYTCKICGTVEDADTNAARNILNRFLNKEPTVPYEQKQAGLCNFA